MYRQDYYRNHRGNDYSTTYIEPKLRKLRQAVQGTKAKPKSKKDKARARSTRSIALDDDP